MQKLMKVLLVVALATMFIVPVAAQEDGNIIIDSTFGSGPVNFNPVTASDATSNQLIGMMYVGLIGVNPETGVIEPGVDGGLAESWEISDDGLVYTFTLTDKYAWTDGTPVTANDVVAMWDAINDPNTQSRLVFLTDTIANVEATDDYTVVVTFHQFNCEALNDAGLTAIPAHLYNGDYSTLGSATFLEPDSVPVVGPYKLDFHTQDQATGLAPAGETYPGDVNNDGYILRVVGDQTVQFEQFLAGEIDINVGPAVDRRADVRAAAEAGNVAYYEYSPGNQYDYMAFNLADPDQPMAAQDEDGNLVEQPPHPIFSDVRVRQALSYAVDVDSIIEGAVFGEGSRMSSTYAEGTWPYNADVPYYNYDPEKASAMLEEAGWVDHDNDPSTPRIAQGALNAEDGTEFIFELVTNQGNSRREAIGTIIQDQLSEIGVQVDFQTVDFNVLLEVMDNQTFDTFILGWQNAYPFRADQAQLWSVTADTIGGNNFTSYINEELVALFEQAKAVPGCAYADRAEIYGEIQTILNRDVPYMYLFSMNGMYAWAADIEGADPQPANFLWNVQEWSHTR